MRCVGTRKAVGRVRDLTRLDRVLVLSHSVLVVPTCSRLLASCLVNFWANKKMVIDWLVGWLIDWLASVQNTVKGENLLLLFSASEMTYIVSSGALNSTHSLCSKAEHFRTSGDYRPDLCPWTLPQPPPLWARAHYVCSPHLATLLVASAEHFSVCHSCLLLLQNALYCVGCGVECYSLTLTATQNSPFLPSGGRNQTSTDCTYPRRDGQAEWIWINTGW